MNKENYQKKLEEKDVICLLSKLDKREQDIITSYKWEEKCVKG